MDNCYLVSFLLINAIFWGLFPHSAHCKLVNDMNKITTLTIKCPPHYIHLIMGVVFYLLTVFFSQKKYLDKLMK